MCFPPTVCVASLARGARAHVESFSCASAATRHRLASAAPFDRVRSAICGIGIIMAAECPDEFGCEDMLIIDDDDMAANPPAVKQEEPTTPHPRRFLARVKAEPAPEESEVGQTFAAAAASPGKLAESSISTAASGGESPHAASASVIDEAEAFGEGGGASLRCSLCLMCSTDPDIAESGALTPFKCWGGRAGAHRRVIVCDHCDTILRYHEAHGHGVGRSVPGLVNLFASNADALHKHLSKLAVLAALRTTEVARVSKVVMDKNMFFVERHADVLNSLMSKRGPAGDAMAGGASPVNDGVRGNLPTTDITALTISDFVQYFGNPLSLGEKVVPLIAGGKIELAVLTCHHHPVFDGRFRLGDAIASAAGGHTDQRLSELFEIRADDMGSSTSFLRAMVSQYVSEQAMRQHLQQGLAGPSRLGTRCVRGSERSSSPPSTTKRTSAAALFPQRQPPLAESEALSDTGADGNDSQTSAAAGQRASTTAVAKATASAASMGPAAADPAMPADDEVGDVFEMPKFVEKLRKRMLDFLSFFCTSTWTQTLRGKERAATNLSQSIDEVISKCVTACREDAAEVIREQWAPVMQSAKVLLVEAKKTSKFTKDVPEGTWQHIEKVERFFADCHRNGIVLDDASNGCTVEPLLHKMKVPNHWENKKRGNTDRVEHQPPPARTAGIA